MGNTQRSFRRPAIVIAVAVIGAAGAAGYAIERFRGAGEVGSVRSPRRTTVLDTLDPVAATQGADRTIRQPVAAPVGPGASSPAEAVKRFVAAEARHDWAGSYALLSATDRGRYTSVESWTMAHGALPPLLHVEIGATTDAKVDGVVYMAPSLDEIRGLVSSVSDSTWLTTDEQGWRVRFGKVELAPRYPSDVSASPAVKQWVEAHQRCAAVEGERSGLVGFPSLADALCKQTGAVSVGPPAELETLKRPSMVVDPFGPDAWRWARVVPVTKPSPMKVVVAPVGDRWQVIGLAPE